MKLRYAPASPFARKVRIVLIETGLDKRVELVNTDPWSDDNDLPKDNPLGKVPTLIDDDGHQVYDSRTICEYLDGMHGGARLVPTEGRARLLALTRQALGDGMLDASVWLRVELVRRPEALRWPYIVARHRAAVARSLATLEHEAGTLTDLASIGDIAVACALGYLDFRFADEPWRGPHPRLAAWFDRQLKRPSMIATMPHV
jgi:glutathione S-transferase